MEAKFIEDNPGVRLVPSSNHKHIIAGQATVTKELFEEVGDLDYLFVCVGGGGLLAGASLAKSELCPSCALIGVEPQNNNDAQMSLAKGEIVSIKPGKTIADGASLPYLGGMVDFSLIKEYTNEILETTDERLVEGMKFFA